MCDLRSSEISRSSFHVARGSARCRTSRLSSVRCAASVYSPAARWNSSLRRSRLLTSSRIWRSRRNSSRSCVIKANVFLLFVRMRRTPCCSRGRKATPVVSGSSGSGGGRSERIRGWASCFRRSTHHAYMAFVTATSGTMDDSCSSSVARGGSCSFLTDFSKLSMTRSMRSSLTGPPV